ncbi:MAG: hypothetical protein ACI81L_002974 [Verrucomicrobiales bacterium]
MRVHPPSSAVVHVRCCEQIESLIEVIINDLSCVVFVDELDDRSQSEVFDPPLLLRPRLSLNEYLLTLLQQRKLFPDYIELRVCLGRFSFHRFRSFAATNIDSG